MDENRFRSLMHQAIGEETIQPWVTSALRARLAKRLVAAGPGRVSLLIAAALVAAVTAAFWFVPEFLPRRTGQIVVPAASQSPVVVASGRGQ